MKNHSRREFLRNMGVASAGTVLLPKFLQAAPSGNRINLLFIMCDQLRFDALSCMDGKVVETPNFDRLAAGGVRFEKAYTQCPISAPARSTLLSGRSIYNHKVINNKQAEKPDPAGNIFPMKTFDEILAEQGYRCEYHGKWHAPAYRAGCYESFHHRIAAGNPMRDPGYDAHLKNSGALDRLLGAGELKLNKTTIYRPNPFDHYYGLSQAELDVTERTHKQADLHGELLIPAELSATAYKADLTIDTLREFAGAPFSITCSFNKPHPSLLPTAPYYGMYPPDEMAMPVSISDLMENSPYPTETGSTNKYRDPGNVKYMISEYYGLVKELDDWLGKILDVLQEKGIEENTLVIFTSDHGEMLSAHGRHGKEVFYEESVHVPLMMRLPGIIPAGTVVTSPVSQIDLFATILDYLGAGIHESDGASLRPLIEKGAAEPRMIFAEWANDDVPGFMAFDGRWKFLFGRTPEASSLDALYDLKTDPHEMNNLLGSNPDWKKHFPQAEAMKKQLIAWLDRVRSPYLEQVRKRKVNGASAGAVRVSL
ncbi:MAG: sulfatase-like hydrolase/transferase [Kiritimatiellales bacterium]